ncbi:MAG: hypothetical protein SAJ37_03740, partial [Oscillatoria sp. PMC 1068.18]|nr:hypothetical protein [Oscillatoria sp. PMC 1076.18]MEC4987839.1 hypothetical protein [Oscillatoria sp. PMC 1068.18]
MSDTIKLSEAWKDGSYKIPHLVAEANERIRKVGEYGSTATICIKKGSLEIQYNHPTIIGANGKAKRQSVRSSWGGANTPINTRHLMEAESVATKITQALTSGTYSDEWKDELIGRKPKTRQQSATATSTEQKLTFHDAWEVINRDWEGRKDKLKSPASSYHGQFSRFNTWEGNDSEFTLKALSQWLKDSKLKGQMKSRHLDVIKRNSMLLEFPTKYLAWIEQELKNTTISKKNSYIPGDKEIIDTYFSMQETCVTNAYTKRQASQNKKGLQLYGILAIYGLRVHEAFSIMNWDNPVIIRNGEFIVVNNDSDDDPTEKIKYQGSDKIIPAINDPNNTEKILVIEKGKTGKRLALPFMPKGKNWFKTFDLIDKPFKEVLPGYKNPLHRNKRGIVASEYYGKWLRDRSIPFTAHKLRHACNIRMHQAGLNHLAIANSLGHTVAMNQSTYLRYQGQESKLEGLKSALNDLRGKENEIQTLRAKVAELESENERLKLQLQRYELERNYTGANNCK